MSLKQYITPREAQVIVKVLSEGSICLDIMLAIWVEITNHSKIYWKSSVPWAGIFVGLPCTWTFIPWWSGEPSALAVEFSLVSTPAPAQPSHHRTGDIHSYVAFFEDVRWPNKKFDRSFFFNPARCLVSHLTRHVWWGTSLVADESTLRQIEWPDIKKKYWNLRRK